ncbi:pyrroline-5-carboxylate reductase [Peribacillus alkalitolerans]|uniref:pyrroline-5-carboxylate reductase n=1 Tax=Peribacillus alkalitolerans TaxID=1550385 RepID=UPI0013D1B4B8|nr:pyrroline-5-carboxylate reductase [Peribacillus alkalitolerans]
MKHTIGFIGCGKMGQAILSGMIGRKGMDPSKILVSARTESTLEDLKTRFEIQGTTNNQEVAKRSDILFLAIKPNLYGEIIESIKDIVRESVIIVTVAAGIDTEYVREAFGREVKVVRTMPNTPSMVGEGMTPYCINRFITEEDQSVIENLLQSIGKCERISENLMDAIPAISGSSPAYVYMMIEAMADGGVKQGIPRDQAYKLAAQAILGAAKMVVETGRHPGALKDDVCTPGGATIEAVASLEKTGFRSSILMAMDECTNKIKFLSETMK